MLLPSQSIFRMSICHLVVAGAIFNVVIFVVYNVISSCSLASSRRYFGTNRVPILAGSCGYSYLLFFTCSKLAVMPEDIAVTSSKSDVDPCSHGRDTDRQLKKVRTDGQRAFQLYIVDLF